MPAREHPAWGLTFGTGCEGSVIEHIDSLRPKFFLGEQVCSFAYSDVCHPTRKPFIEQFLDCLQQIRDKNGQVYNMKVVRLRASIWAADIERDRLFLCASVSLPN
jgi:hypothetical protein